MWWLTMKYKSLIFSNSIVNIFRNAREVSNHQLREKKMIYITESGANSDFDFLTVGTERLNGGPKAQMLVHT